MKNTVEIFNIKQNKIIIKKRRKKAKNISIFSLVTIILIFSIMSFGTGSIKQISSNMSYIYDPVNSLYSDNSSIIFASVNAISKENLDFVLPIVGAKVSVENSGDIRFEIKNSIMVKATESGVVQDVGVTNDGIKYIKILHCVDVSSLIENVDIVGVVVGDVVKKGQDIATCKNGDIVTLKLMDNNIQISNIKINQSKIICQK